MDPTIPPVRYVVLDTETTGLSPVEDRIVELAAVSFDAPGDRIDWFEQLIDPGCPIAPERTAIHGIDDAMVSGAPTLSQVMPRFLQFVEGAVLVAHNAPYDIAMLLIHLVRSAGPQAAPGNLVLDTFALARAILPRAPSYRLQSLARQLGLEHARAHRARADVAACLGLFRRLIERAGDPSSGPESLSCRAGVRLRFGLQEELLGPGAGEPSRLGLLREALRGSRRIRIEYHGGTKGRAPRDVTPVLLETHDGLLCLLANCHLDRTLKRFRMDRIGRVAACS